MATITVDAACNWVAQNMGWPVESRMRHSQAMEASSKIFALLDAVNRVSLSRIESEMLHEFEQASGTSKSYFERIHGDTSNTFALLDSVNKVTLSRIEAEIIELKQTMARIESLLEVIRPRKCVHFL